MVWFVIYLNAPLLVEITAGSEITEMGHCDPDSVLSVHLSFSLPHALFLPHFLFPSVTSIFIRAWSTVDSPAVRQQWNAGRKQLKTLRALFLIVGWDLGNCIILPLLLHLVVLEKPQCRKKSWISFSSAVCDNVFVCERVCVIMFHILDCLLLFSLYTNVYCKQQRETEDKTERERKKGS